MKHGDSISTTLNTPNLPDGMLHPAPTLDQARLRRALTTVLNEVQRRAADQEYRLVGTGAALLNGVDLPAADLDILMKERASVDAWAAVLDPFRCIQSPAWLPDAHQYYANYEVDGVEVQISTVEAETDADHIETLGTGPWRHFNLVPCDRHMVPTVALELRLITELFRQRSDRSEPIIKYLRAHGCDVAFLQRAMEASRIDPDTQDTTLRQLESAPIVPIRG